MKKIIMILVLTLICSSNTTLANQNIPVTFKTDPPVLTDKSDILYTMTESEYKKMAAILAKESYFVPITRQPTNLSAAKFGFNLVIKEKNTGWILDGDETLGYTLYADINVDGDLTNDSPLKLKKTDGKYTYIFHKILTETVDNRQQKYPVDLKIEVSEAIPPGKTEKQLVLKTSDVTVRRGILKIDNRQIAFELNGIGGIYNGQFHNLYFDLNGDGRFDTQTRYSEESYKIPEKYINIGETTYEFSVDRYGNSLTLTPLAKKFPERAILSPGNPAPDFHFKDLAGNQRKLSDYRGKIVLIDIWAMWCPFCITEAPALAATHKKFKDKGFEIVSFNKGDAIENLQKFIGQKEMNWTHSQADEAFLKLYRVDRYPTYFLLDKEGKIISNTMRPGEEMYQKIERMLED